MALAVGDQAPDFTLPSTSGSNFTLSKDMAGKPCIIYFYPKDFTPTCTKEACNFRDNIDVFKGLNIDVLGISRDSVGVHHKFRKEYTLDFNLLADEDGAVCGLYKAVIPVVRMPKRITYLLDKDHKIAAVVNNMFSATAHIQELVDHLHAAG